MTSQSVIHIKQDAEINALCGYTVRSLIPWYEGPQTPIGQSRATCSACIEKAKVMGFRR